LCCFGFAASSQKNYAKRNCAQRLFWHIHAKFLTVESCRKQAS
jgi:hypothetical protein